MTEVKLVKLKLKNGNKKIWLDWCEELKQRKNEVIETLRNEGVISESCFLSEDEKYIYYFMEAEDFKKVKEAVNKSNFNIDHDHKIKRKLSLEKVCNLTELFHFENRNKQMST
jgi:L-rhamnose mutarotase